MLSVAFVWSVLGLEIVQFTCKLCTFNNWKWKHFGEAIVAFILTVMLGLQIWATVNEEKAMKPVVDSTLLSPVHSCLLFHLFYLFATGLLFHKEYCISAKKSITVPSGHKQLSSSLIGTASGETTPGYSNLTSSYQTSLVDSHAYHP